MRYSSSIIFRMAQKEEKVRGKKKNKKRLNEVQQNEVNVVNWLKGAQKLEEFEEIVYKEIKVKYPALQYRLMMKIWEKKVKMSYF